MRESKIEITERLRREGRWAEASLWRDSRRRELRADGATRQEANDQSWNEIGEKFPALNEEAETLLLPVYPLAINEALAVGPSLTDCDNGPPNFVQDGHWVYANLENQRATAIAAPSAGAWSMLKWARKSPDKFFQTILPKVLAVLPLLPKTSEAEIVAHEELALAELAEMIRQTTPTYPTNCPACGVSLKGT